MKWVPGLCLQQLQTERFAYGNNGQSPRAAGIRASDSECVLLAHIGLRYSIPVHHSMHDEDVTSPRACSC